MSSKPTLTAERLRELLHYDPETGVFIRRVSTGSRTKIGDVAGGVRPDGYRMISVDGRLIRAHRLAWLYVHGVWPVDQVDHINGDGLDNRIVNLREANQGTNQQNLRGPLSNNRSGYLGVFIHSQTGRWCAQIAVNGRSKHLGCFATPEEASAAYQAAKTELHPFWSGVA